ncbi:GNAT family N-acetyltransferase [Acidocella aminolytica]|uniref:Acetyltransferase n=1 Tax=Acidocella aminolytica 101 = DSM 11237 TaxID=1120923 RepID=A0A0D6PAG6_9PROT|nr:GNAT family N-acetyltransferase [Acidocella aminolytica]GAN78647.1 acetyltransferase [Acidocella aminolytica 101 = DSM 11237]GBQ36744.1 N-acetyltransferase GCN5 [Acidocella aminolytica 101 = DSM 11237]SHE44261.1 Predicted N-acyltransferase, GNAT family [Acidocella aminolytica 101 = DSM 11237]
MITLIRAVHGSPELTACFAIRMAVFVDEQKVPAEEEMDALDAGALHLLAIWNGSPAGTARAVEKTPGIWKIGRVAVAAGFRGHGIGVALMRGIEAACAGDVFVLDAQTHAVGFYEKLGYAAEGPKFLDAGIPHLFMRKDGSAG